MENYYVIKFVYSSVIYLVSHVKVDQEVLLLANGAQLFPLSWGWVDTGWVMSTGVENNDSSIWDIITEIIVTALSIETTSGWIVVGE